jgi:hypothetical protein
MNPTQIQLSLDNMFRVVVELSFYINLFHCIGLQMLA